MMRRNGNVSDGERPGVRVKRLLDGPIISSDLHPSIGPNIQGPSIIKAPEWIEGRLGDYYLYFADHKGRYIRLAYADNLQGPWRIYPPGSLQLEESRFLTEPPKVTAEQFAQFETQLQQCGPALMRRASMKRKITPNSPWESGKCRLNWRKHDQEQGASRISSAHAVQAAAIA
jgi:hypothetical protein